MVSHHPGRVKTLPAGRRQRVPAVELTRNYPRAWLRGDVLAGATAAAVVIPQAMAYATVAGLPVQVGLYTCIVPMLTYAVLGGARRMSVSTTSTIVALTGAALASAGVGAEADDLVAQATTLTFLVGATLLVARVLQLGFVVEAVSETVLIGLKVGVGLTIAASQLPKLLGIAGPAEPGFFHDVGNALRHLGDADGTTVLLAGGTIAGLLATRRLAPRLPGPLLALAAGIGLVVVFGIDDDGVALIAEVPRGLATPALPAFEHVDAFLPYAFAIAVMAYLESVSVARSTREVHDPPLDNGRELVAVGAASVTGSFFQTVPAAGGFSQTLVNADAGARTQLSELVTAGLAVLTALVLAPVLSDLPQATLGAIVFVAVLGLIGPADLQRLARIDRIELFLALLTGAVALASNLLVGVAVGVAGTYYLVLRALNHPSVVELRPAGSDGGGRLAPARPGDPPIPGMLVLRVEGGMYTFNVRSVQEEVLRRVAEREPPPEVVVLDVSGTSDTSVTVMDVFAETDERLQHDGVALWVAGLPTRALAKARRTAAWATWVEAGKLHPSAEAAVAAHVTRRG